MSHKLSRLQCSHLHSEIDSIYFYKTVKEHTRFCMWVVFVNCEGVDIIIIIMIIISSSSIFQLLESELLYLSLNISARGINPSPLHLVSISCLYSSAILPGCLIAKDWPLATFPLFLSSLGAQGEEGPDPRPYTFKETRHVEIFTALGRSSQTSLWVKDWLFSFFF